MNRLNVGSSFKSSRRRVTALTLALLINSGFAPLYAQNLNGTTGATRPPHPSAVWRREVITDMKEFHRKMLEKARMEAVRKVPTGPTGRWDPAKGNFVAIPQIKFAPAPKREEEARSFIVGDLNIVDEKWRLKVAKIEAEIGEVQREKARTETLGAEYLQRFEKARAEAERLAQTKRLLSAQARAKYSEFKKLVNNIPHDAKTLVRQKQFIEEEIDRINSGASGTLDATTKFQKLTSLTGELKSVNRALDTKLKRTPAQSNAIAGADRQFGRLESQYWTILASEKHALRDMSLVVPLLERNMDELDALDDSLRNLEKKRRGLDENGAPFIHRVIVSADDNIVYQSEFQAPFEEVKKLEAKIKQGEQSLAGLEKAKTMTFDSFMDKARMASEALADLHGNMGKGNGVLATINDTFTNNGSIMWNARLTAAGEFGVNAYEVFGESWMKGGPVAAVIDTLYKVAFKGLEVGADAAGLPELVRERFGNSNPTKEDLRANVKDPTSTPELIRTGVTRAVKDGITRHVKSYANSTVGASVQRKIYSDQFYKLMSSTDSSRVLEARVAALLKASDRVNALSNPSKYGVKDFSRNIIKDAIKTSAKKFGQQLESATWQKFFLAEAQQVVLFSVYQEASDMYWARYDSVARMKAELARLIDGYDRRNGFKVVRNNKFDRKVRLAIRVDLLKPEGHSETVFMGGVIAKPTAPHRYWLPAEAMTTGRKGEPIKVNLRIEQH